MCTQNFDIVRCQMISTNVVPIAQMENVVRQNIRSLNVQSNWIQHVDADFVSKQLRRLTEIDLRNQRHGRCVEVIGERSYCRCRSDRNLANFDPPPPAVETLSGGSGGNDELEMEIFNTIPPQHFRGLRRRSVTPDIHQVEDSC